MKDADTIDKVKTFVKENAKMANFMGVTIKTLPIPTREGQAVLRYWIGQKSFRSKDLAQASIVSVKTAIESQGGSFDRALKLIDEFAPTEPKAMTREEIIANYEREEKLAVQMIDWLGVGEKLWGPLHTPTSPYGESLLWQSFGETSFRFTNLEHDEYYAQVGYWTNRFVLKGIQGPFETTFDPYFEMTPTLETNGVNYKSNMDLSAGIEWYPFMRNASLQNYGPYGIAFLNFVRNYRLYVQYMFRENLKDEITGSKDVDLRAGAAIFYEWGIDLPMLGTKPPAHRRIIDYVTDYVWGEYFGTYHYEQTDFSSIKNYSSWILNTSLILGIKWPSIPLPPNRFNDSLDLMPYLRFEHVTNPNHPLFYQNQYFLAAGIRWMPFRTYEYSENEWLFKTRLFFEYVGIGGTWWPSANTPTDTPNHDFRFGIGFSHRRF